MCAKIVQNHETKEQKAKIPTKVLLSRIFYVPLPPTTSHWNRLVAQRRELFDRQIMAEWGNENRCQFVTQIFLNPWNCLYLQKVCDFIQFYEIILAIPNLTPIIYLLFCSVSAFQLCLEPKDIMIPSNLILLLLVFCFE